MDINGVQVLSTSVLLPVFPPLGIFSSARAIACSLPFSRFPLASSLVRRLGQKRGTLMATVFQSDDELNDQIPTREAGSFSVLATTSNL